MSTWLLVVRSQPLAGAEQEFDRWYDEEHIPEVLATLPAIVSGHRYVVAEDQVGPEVSVPSRLGLYQIETDDLQSVLTAASWRRRHRRHFERRCHRSP